MIVLKRLLLALGAVVGALLYLWVAAVRSLPRVRRRKAELRRRRYGPNAGSRP